MHIASYVIVQPQLSLTHHVSHPPPHPGCILGHAVQEQDINIEGAVL